MLRNPDGPLPRMHVLRVFEAAGRHSSFIRAAEELATHQPSVSRYIAELEHEIGVQLFERYHSGVSLTSAGEEYYRSVAAGLKQIAEGANMAANELEKQRVIVSCSFAISHQFVMPRFKFLREKLGENISLRIITIEYDILKSIGEHEADLIVTYDKTRPNKPEDSVVLFREAVAPVCSPDFALTHANILTRPVAEWGALPFLRLVNNYDWTTWHDWFESAGGGYPSPEPEFINIDDYVYLIEAAVDGQGLALGWQYFIDHYLDNGKLASLGGDFVKRDRCCYVELTKRGRRRAIARHCLDIFSTLKNTKPCAT